MTSPDPGALSGRTLSAAQWRFASAVVQGALQFGVGVLLARLLPPEDFGLVALALVVIGFATLVSDLGVGPALVQNREIGERHLRVALTVSLGFAAGLAAILFAASPLLGTLLRSEQLPGVLRLQSLAFVLGGAGVSARALLQRGLRFRELFWVSALSYLVGYAGVSAALALAGFGVWSLVWGALVQAGLESLLAQRAARTPLRPLLARRELRELLGFGVGASLNNIVNYAARNGDNLIVGRWLGAGALGLYGRAYNLMMLPLNYLGLVISSVLFPAMAEIQHDRQRLGRAYLLSVQMASLVAAPVMVGMVVAAPHMVPALYGPNWTGTILPLQVLCCAGLFRVVYHLAGSVMAASGKIYLELKRQVGYAVLVVVGGLIGTRWGVVGVAVGVSVAILYMYVAMAALALRTVERRPAEFAAAHLPGLWVAGVVAATAVPVRFSLERLGAGSGWIFAALLLCSAAATLAGLYLLPERVRPRPLFQRLGTVLVRLPSPLQLAMGRILHLSSTPGV